MPEFAYRAKLGPEQILQGTIEASDERAASRQLTGRGLFLVSLDVKKSPRLSRISWPGRKVRSGDIGLFTGQMADLLDSGMPVYQALNVIRSQASNPSLKDVLTDLATSVKDGASLSAALGRHPDLFSNLYAGMVRSGEESGTLVDVLMRLGRHMEQTEEVKRTIKSALVYPSLVLAVGIVSIVVLLTVVVPRLVGLFEELGQTLPLPTRAIIALSDFFVAYGWVAALVALVGIAVYLRRGSLAFVGRVLDRVKLRTPLLRDLHKKGELGEYAHTLATLLIQKVPMVHALRIARDTVGNHVLNRRLAPVAPSVSNGEKLYVALRDTALFTPFVLNVLSVGEESGKPEAALAKVADIYRNDVTTLTRRLTSLLEPAIIVLLAAGLGFIVFAIIMPILQVEPFQF